MATIKKAVVQAACVWEYQYNRCNSDNSHHSEHKH